MKKLFLFLLASVMCVNMFAQDEPSGKTKADAIPYNWNSGIKVDSKAGVGTWYVVGLLETGNPAGPFKANGKTADGKTDINVMVVNPLDRAATIDVVAYIGDNETSRNFTLQSGDSKTMNFGAGMFVRMGINYVYLYLVMDVDMTPADQDSVQVNVQPAESNSTPFIPEDFNWTGFGDNTEAQGNDIVANKETWIKIDGLDNKVGSGETFEIIVRNLGSATTIYGGFATDCPATNIQEQEKAVGANGEMTKVLDKAMLDMLPSTIYIRLKAGQALHVTAKRVPEVLPAQPLFTVSGETTVAKNTLYNLTDSILYKIAYATLTAPEYFVTKVEVKNNGASAVELTGKVVKNAQPGDEVFSAVTRTTTIQPGQTLTKDIDKTLMGNLEAGDEVFALILGEDVNASFKLVEVCTEEDPCVPASAIPMTLSTTEIASKDQAAGTTKWYAVNIAAAKSNQADIILTMDAGSEQAEVTVDVAADCALGEPTQTYTGKSTSTTKTLNYSLFEHAENVVYIRVKTDKAITVNAEVLTSIRWNGSSWAPQAPAADGSDAVRIEGDLTIDGTLKVLGLTLAGGNLSIANTGKLIVGAEGVKGSEIVGQIVVEEGGQLLISPAATTNNKPFITAKKTLHFGDAVSGARRAEKHEFIALPVDNREENVGVRYFGWDHNAGWVANGFNKSFTGYDVYQTSGDPNYTTFTGLIKGQLAGNKNQTLSMPGRGWHAFGNSWLTSLAVTDILANVGAAEQAVHMYVATPQVIAGTSYGLENDEKLYIPVTTAIIAQEPTLANVAAMQGFFLFTESATAATLNYNALFDAKAAAPAKRAENNRNNVAAVIRGGNQSDFVFMIEDEDANVHKMQSTGLAIYAEDGLGQVANSNLIGTILTIHTNNASEYTLSFIWLNGETLVLQDLETGAVIDMTVGNTYTFTAEPNSVSERFQIIGRKNVPTNVESNAAIEGANKRIENGKVVIIKNGVKYNVLGAQL